MSVPAAMEITAKMTYGSHELVASSPTIEEVEVAPIWRLSR
jgi:hypothetical protein